jgi:hypothetical protein
VKKNVMRRKERGKKDRWTSTSSISNVGMNEREEEFVQSLNQNAFRLALPSTHTATGVPKMVASKTLLYEASTQFKNWRYSPDTLAKVRASLNAAAVAVIRNTFEADQVSFVPSTTNAVLSALARILVGRFVLDSR